MPNLKPLMNQNFLEYASYVIKERAIPDANDGLKPVQRRILHTMMKMDDGKFNKVANIVGETMKLHPHGDASIGSALVVLANKEYFIEKQGNFGNILTGDPASAARYIEARLTPLAKEVLFNPEVTEFIESYDGRNKEPVTLPCKIAATLLLGAEGIAVGMSTRILPHNFNEVIDAQIAYLKKEEFELFPDFNGGYVDVGQYNQGNGKVKCRAKVEEVDDKTLHIVEVPFGVTTESLINSIQDAVNKGKFKLTSINDFTAEKVLIELKAPRGTQASELIKPLYAFTHCEVSISVNLLVIKENQPAQLTVNDLIAYNSDRLVYLLDLELNIELTRLKDKLFEKELEQYFITRKVYQEIETCETWEEVLSCVRTSVTPVAEKLGRSLEKEHVDKLLSIPIKRISKFDVTQSQQELEKIRTQIAEVEKSLTNVTRFTINYLKNLKKKYGNSYPRNTRISNFEDIELKEVAIQDLKVGWDRQTGYVGTEIKADDAISCSPYDKIVMFFEDGTYQILKVPDKLFVGKGLVFLDRQDNDQVYNLIYYENSDQICYAKRFQINKFILEKEYELFKKQKGASVVHFSRGNGTLLEIRFVPAPRLRKTRELFIFDNLQIKGASARGNRVSTKAVKSVKDVSKSQLTNEQLALVEDDPIPEDNQLMKISKEDFTEIPLPTDGKLFRSRMPFSDFDPAGWLIDEYHAQQINTVVILTSKTEYMMRAGRDLIQFYQNEGFEVLQMDIVDFGIPGQEAMKRMVQCIYSHLEEGKNVVMHCFAGIGRAGMTAACLVKSIKEVDGETAIKFVKQFVPSAVQTRDQANFVINFNLNE